MSDVRAMLKGMNFSQAVHLPVVAAFCRRIGLVDAVNAAVPTELAVDVGTVQRKGTAGDQRAQQGPQA